MAPRVGPMSAYLIVDIDVHDMTTYDEYRKHVPAIVAKHGGSYLVRGGDPETVEGEWQSTRLVVLRFPDRAAGNAFLEDPEYAPVKALRHAASTSNGEGNTRMT